MTLGEWATVGLIAFWVVAIWYLHWDQNKKVDKMYADHKVKMDEIFARHQERMDALFAKYRRG